MHMGGVRQAARCPYGAAEPPWAMVRCYSSSHPPILYTSCVGLLQLLTHNYLEFLRILGYFKLSTMVCVLGDN